MDKTELSFEPKTISTPKGDLVLRMAGPEDAERFRDMRLTALQLHPEVYGSSYEESVAQPMDHWVGRLSGNGVIAVLDNGRELVGMAGLRPEESMKTRHSAIIWGVFVRPEYRGLGLSRNLLETLLAVARATTRLKRLELGVLTINTPALRLYESLGFRIFGTSPKVLFTNNVYYDEHLMALLIGDLA